jgi:hypothetical protein
MEMGRFVPPEAFERDLSTMPVAERLLVVLLLLVVLVVLILAGTRARPPEE